MKVRRILYLAIAVEALLILIIFLYPQKKLPKEFSIGELNLSNLTFNQAGAILEKYEDRPLYLNLPNRSFSVNYSDMGIIFNHEILKDYTELCFMNTLCKRFDQSNESSLDNLVEINEVKFNEFLSEVNSELSGITDTPIISLVDFEFSAVSSDALVEIDKIDLLNKLIPDNIYRNARISLKLNKTYEGNLNEQRNKTNELLNRVSSLSFTVKFGRTEVKLSDKDIKKFFLVKEKEGRSVVFVSNESVSNYLEDVIENRNVAAEIDSLASIDTVRYAILLRVPEEKISRAIVLPLKGGPSTDGSLHNKYLELNKSQQRLYRFENGDLTKTYIISTGVTWETPAGNFNVLRKTPMTISYFGQWYMPWYLPIGTVNGPYYFGFHEVPYHRDASGNIFSRNPETIGSPATGGCIQLLKGEAEELFHWAEIGTPVIIHD